MDFSRFNISHTETDIGTQFESEHHTVFFGNKFSSLERIAAHFKQIHFFGLKQVHGDRTVEANSVFAFQTEADAHFTSSLGHGLCIYTADCMPVMVFSQTDPKILAIHAGWRGVINQIVPKAIKMTFSKFDDLLVFIGPHIQFSSFEIENSFRDAIIASHENAPSLFKKTGENKSQVDLSGVVRQQAHSLGLPADRISINDRDTFQNLLYHSYRRDRETAGRQISFICRKK